MNIIHQVVSSVSLITCCNNLGHFCYFVGRRSDISLKNVASPATKILYVCEHLAFWLAMQRLLLLCGLYYLTCRLYYLLKTGNKELINAGLILVLPLLENIDFPYCICGSQISHNSCLFLSQKATFSCGVCLQTHASVLCTLSLVVLTSCHFFLATTIKPPSLAPPTTPLLPLKNPTPTLCTSMILLITMHFIFFFGPISG